MHQDTLKPTGASAFAGLGRERLMLIADGLAVALAMSLPWSTSGTGILVVLWLVAVMPTIEPAGLRREALTFAGGLPVLLVLLALLGMLWADVPFNERWHGLDSFLKLLVIPLLMFHFGHSENGAWVLKGFLAACGVLLVYSWWLLFFPGTLWAKPGSIGVPVKDYISQSGMFTICVAATMELAVRAWDKSRRDLALAYAVLAVAFAANIFYISTSRTGLVFLPVLLLLFGFKRLNWKGALGLVAALIVLIAVAWQSSGLFRQRVNTVLEEIRIYRTTNARTSAGERLEFWKKSLEFIAAAPLIGHGTGTIREQFSRAATADGATSALVTTNPHNQTLAIGIQLGLLGIAVLFAMWIAHLLLFRGEGMAAWLGLVIVVQNIVGSLFNSHLFDFTQGWGYVIGVGIAGGVVAARSRAANNVGEKRPVP
ncbi:MAG TPA: O-antigen ligase family protein [Xanthobacteraceae bacterium]|nr:O-antigen ligase family protein [Xanthobacteraceae bacterium]